ncbi:MAG: diphthine synthase [Candidatus Micrarchaeales archaeon]|nr:diphthine synthase [Candidatus Micrarchaeales archaeon]
MLYLIGIGLNKKDFPIGAVDLCEKCDVYIDRYTTFVDDERMSYITGLLEKKPVELGRAQMEEELPELLGEAKERDVALLIGGDPLVATTHKIIFIEAKKAGVRVEVRHASSILSAIIGESGLDFYRFGAICTVSRWTTNYTPTSFYETIKKNRSNNLHSIVLLDYDPVKNSSLETKEAIRIMEAAEAQYKSGIITDDSAVFIMHKIALDDQQKLLTTIREAKRLTFPSGPTAMIIPANLSDIEKETIESMY